MCWRLSQLRTPGSSGGGSTDVGVLAPKEAAAHPPSGIPLVAIRSVTIPWSGSRRRRRLLLPPHRQNRHDLRRLGRPLAVALPAAHAGADDVAQVDGAGGGQGVRDDLVVHARVHRGRDGGAHGVGGRQERRRDREEGLNLVLTMTDGPRAIRLRLLFPG